MLIRSIIDDPKNMPTNKTIDPKSIANKNAGPTGCVLMVDCNRAFALQSLFHVIVGLTA